MTRSNREDNEFADANDLDRIFGKLSSLPSYERYPELMTQCRPIVELWHDTFAFGSPAYSIQNPQSKTSEQKVSQLWRRMRRNLPKELNEIAFILDEMIRLCNEFKSTIDVNKDSNDENGKITIIDMCSGVGYLSMFLSHLLPPEKVSRIIPIDILFPAHNANIPSSPQTQSPDINAGAEDTARTNCHVPIDHLRSSIHPIPIHPRRANIKKGRELRQIAKYSIARAKGPIIILGVHLCKSLSVHTIRLFNTSLTTEIKNRGGSTLYLKPCCLPGRKDLRRKHPPFWEFGHMKRGGFGVKTLYCKEINSSDSDKTQVQVGSMSAVAGVKSSLDTIEGDSGKDQQHETTQTDPKSNVLFNRWVQLLHNAVDDSGNDVAVNIKSCPIQLQHFQNQFIVARTHSS